MSEEQLVDSKRPFAGLTSDQVKVAKKWATAFKAMDQTGSNFVTYTEYWDWVRDELQLKNFTDTDLIRVEEHWNENFYQISKKKWYFDWADMKNWIRANPKLLK